MIRSKTEYREAVKGVREEERRLSDQRAKLKEMGLGREEIKRAMDPLLAFHEQLKEEVESYERLKRGEFEEIRNFTGLGRLLIAVRISQGLSQRELAERLGVHETQVSRDERNEYHGITVERANRILEALGVEVRTTVASLSKALPA
jgi:DNA-binding XRE family transcriptional regulator